MVLFVAGQSVPTAGHLVDRRSCHVGGAFGARALGGRESDPRCEGPRVLEMRELARLEDEVGHRRDVDVLEASELVDSALPSGLLRLCLDQLLEAGLLLAGRPHPVHAVGERVAVGLLGELHALQSSPVGGCPVALAPSRRGELVEHEAVPEEELGEKLLGVARFLAFVVGHPDLDDASRGERPREELDVVATVLPSSVNRGLDHLGHSADHAVHAEGELLLELEADRSVPADALGGLRQGVDPIGDGDMVSAERGGPHLAGHDVDGDGLDRVGVGVEPYESDSIQHSESLP